MTIRKLDRTLRRSRAIRPVLRVVVACAALVGCGPPSSPAAPTSPPTPREAAVVSAERAERLERERRSDLATAHRELEVEQQDALAATCDRAAGSDPQERCEPSCYRAEPADPRAGRQLRRAEIVHLACVRADGTEPGPIMIADEIGGSQIAVRAARGRLPKPHKKGAWQAEVEEAVAAALQPELGRGDVIRVTGTWKAIAHPLTRERLRCVTVSHHVTAMRRALDACGARGGVACEAAGNAAAHGINVVHYRLAEARRLHAAGKLPECQRAALEAIAVARGLPRWRQYAALNVGTWKTYPRYRTRFDGHLGEEALFSTASALGTQAQVVHGECGGPANPQTTATQEQSFHTCW